MSAEIPQCGIELIKRFEGYHEKLPDGRARAYPDPLSGWALPTIGYGSTTYPDGSRVKKGDIITQDEAQACLRHEIEEVIAPVLERIPTWEQMNKNRRAALISFAYNLGAHFYRARDRGSITRVCDTPEMWGDKKWVENQFSKYCNPGTPVEAGLRRRRKAEAELFCTPVMDEP